MTLAKKIAISLIDTHTWYIANHQTHGDQTMISADTDGRWMISPDDSFTGTTQQFINYVKGKYPHVQAVFVTPEGLSSDTLGQLERAANQVGLLLELDE